MASTHIMLVIAVLQKGKFIMTLEITATDMFCGAGGSTTGATQAGVNVKLAINHWKRAIETHNTNYPQTTHALTDLHKANPRRFPTTDILIASPECTSHSISKGRKRTGQAQLKLWETGEPDLEAETEERSRCTMWTPLDWAEYHNYQAVILENVVDAHLWRPFDAWLQAWKSLDYVFEIVYINSMHIHPTPQSRDRMYFIAWKKGNRKPDLKITPLAYCQKCGKNVDSVQSWKNPTRRYGKYRQQYVYCCPICATVVMPYYYAAANAIDWSLPSPRIGDRVKPLREKTMQRIAYGLEKYACDPFTVQINKTSDRVRGLLGEAFPTQTGDNGLAMVVPFLINLTHSTIRPIEVSKQAFPTQTAYDASGVVVPPFIAELHGTSKARSVTDALATICAGGQHHGLVIPPALLLQTSHGESGHASYVADPQESPFPTQTTRQDLAVVTPSWLMTYYNNGQMVEVSQTVPTVTTLERHALITASTSLPEVSDCGFRMLAPHEIQAAMAFPASYILTGTRKEQVKMLGNAVTPPVMKLLMERVVSSLA